MAAACNGKTDCLSALIQAKANLDVQDAVRSCGDVVWVPGCNIDYLVLESALGQRRYYGVRVRVWGVGCRV